MSSAAYFEFDEPISRSDWLAFCEEQGIIYSQNTVGGTVSYKGDIEVSFGEPHYHDRWQDNELPEKASGLTVSTFYGGNVAGVAELTKAVWRRWQGASVRADPEVREAMWR